MGFKLTDTDKMQVLKTSLIKFYTAWGYQTMYSLEDDKSQKYIYDLHKFRFYAFMITISLWHLLSIMNNFA